MCSSQSCRFSHDEKDIKEFLASQSADAKQARKTDGPPPRVPTMRTAEKDDGALTKAKSDRTMELEGDSWSHVRGGRPAPQRQPLKLAAPSNRNAPKETKLDLKPKNAFDLLDGGEEEEEEPA